LHENALAVEKARHSRVATAQKAMFVSAGACLRLNPSVLRFPAQSGERSVMIFFHQGRCRSASQTISSVVKARWRK